jgi:hypothetical protein
VQWEKQEMRSTFWLDNNRRGRENVNYLGVDGRATQQSLANSGSHLKITAVRKTKALWEAGGLGSHGRCKHLIKANVHTTFQSQNVKERDSLGDLVADGNIVLKWISHEHGVKMWVRLNWTLQPCSQQIWCRNHRFFPWVQNQKQRVHKTKNRSWQNWAQMENSGYLKSAVGNGGWWGITKLMRASQWPGYEEVSW